MAGERETVLVALSRDEAWMVYRLVAARSETLAAAEDAAMQNVGGAPWYRLEEKLRAILDARAARLSGGDEHDG